MSLTYDGKDMLETGLKGQELIAHRFKKRLEMIQGSLPSSQSEDSLRTLSEAEERLQDLNMGSESSGLETTEGLGRGKYQRSRKGNRSQESTHSSKNGSRSKFIQYSRRLHASIQNDSSSDESCVSRTSLFLSSRGRGRGLLCSREAPSKTPLLSRFLRSRDEEPSPPTLIKSRYDDDDDWNDEFSSEELIRDPIRTTPKYNGTRHEETSDEYSYRGGDRKSTSNNKVVGKTTSSEDFFSSEIESPLPIKESRNVDKEIDNFFPSEEVHSPIIVPSPEQVDKPIHKPPIHELDYFFPSDCESPPPMGEILHPKVSREVIDELDYFFPSDEESSPDVPNNITSYGKGKTSQKDSFDDFFPSDEESSPDVPINNISSGKENTSKKNSFNDFFPSDEESSPDVPINNISSGKENTSKKNSFNDFFPSDEESSPDVPIITKPSALKNNSKKDSFEQFFPSSSEESLKSPCDEQNINKFNSQSNEPSSIDTPPVMYCRGYVLRSFNPNLKVEKTAHFSSKEKEEMEKRISEIKRRAMRDTEPKVLNVEQAESENAENANKIFQKTGHQPYWTQIPYLKYGEYFQGKDTILLQSRNSFSGIATAIVAILNSSNKFGRILDGIYSSIIRGNNLSRGQRDLYRRDFDTLVRQKIKPRILPDLYSINFIPVHEGKRPKEDFFVVEIFVDKYNHLESTTYEVAKQGKYIWKNNAIEKII